MMDLYGFMDSTTKLLQVKVDDMATLQACMDVLRDFRAEESHIDMKTTPIQDMYEVRSFTAWLFLLPSLSTVACC